MKTMNGRNRILFENMLSTSYRAGIYCRLSKDDDLRGESASISNLNFQMSYNQNKIERG